MLISFTRAENFKEKLFERVPTYPERGRRDLESPRHVHSPGTLDGGTLWVLYSDSIDRHKGYS